MAKKTKNYRKEALYKKGVVETISAIVQFLKQEEKVTRTEMKAYAKGEEYESAFGYKVEAELYRFLIDAIGEGRIDQLIDILDAE